MLVISYGVPKSGSTLAFELVRGVLMAAGFPQRRLPDGAVLADHRVNFIHLGAETRPVVERILAALSPREIAVVKTHDVFDDAQREYLGSLIAAGKLRVQVCQRDPRDVCLSLIDAGAQARAKGRTKFSDVVTLEDAVNWVRGRLPHLGKWQELPHVLSLEYGTLAFDSLAAVRQIEAHLGVRTNALAAIRYAFLIAFTQRNKAIRERHKAELTPEQTETLTSTFGDFLDAYGYAR